MKDNIQYLLIKFILTGIGSVSLGQGRALKADWIKYLKVIKASFHIHFQACKLTSEMKKTPGLSGAFGWSIASCVVFQSMSFL